MRGDSSKREHGKRGQRRQQQIHLQAGRRDRARASAGSPSARVTGMTSSAAIMLMAERHDHQHKGEKAELARRQIAHEDQRGEEMRPRRRDRARGGKAIAPGGGQQRRSRGGAASAGFQGQGHGRVLQAAARTCAIGQAQALPRASAFVRVNSKKIASGLVTA